MPAERRQLKQFRTAGSDTEWQGLQNIITSAAKQSTTLRASKIVAVVPIYRAGSNHDEYLYSVYRNIYPINSVHSSHDSGSLPLPGTFDPEGESGGSSSLGWAGWLASTGKFGSGGWFGSFGEAGSVDDSGEGLRELGKSSPTCCFMLPASWEIATVVDCGLSSEAVKVCTRLVHQPR